VTARPPRRGATSRNPAAFPARQSRRYRPDDVLGRCFLPAPEDLLRHRAFATRIAECEQWPPLGGVSAAAAAGPKVTSGVRAQ
jgi:hypothetical protein